DLRLDRARLERAAAERKPQRHAQQLRVGALLPRARVAVVEEYVEPGGAELLVELLRRVALGRAGLPQGHELDVPRRDRTRPGDALLVGVLLDGRRGDARRADAVGAHPDELLAARLVEIRRAEGLGVSGAELEDVPHFDRALDPAHSAVDT